MPDDAHSEIQKAQMARTASRAAVPAARDQPRRGNGGGGAVRRRPAWRSIPSNLRDLILADSSPGTALGMLLFGFVVTFGSTAMGTAIMAMGRQGEG